MASPAFSFRAEVWEHEGPGSWHFVSLPTSVADEIEETSGGKGAGFGSVRVEATVGSTRWCTSLFPDAGRRTYVLPLKKAVRQAEGLSPGSMTTIDVTVID
jgi:hypothetical protein